MTEEEEILNEFTRIDERLFVQYSSISHVYKVNQFQAEFLNTKYGIEICYCTVSSGADTFTSYLAIMGYGDNQRLIGDRLSMAIHDAIYNI